MLLWPWVSKCPAGSETSRKQPRPQTYRPRSHASPYVGSMCHGFCVSQHILLDKQQHRTPIFERFLRGPRDGEAAEFTCSMQRRCLVDSLQLRPRQLLTFSIMAFSHSWNSSTPAWKCSCSRVTCSSRSTLACGKGRKSSLMQVPSPGCFKEGLPPCVCVCVCVFMGCELRSTLCPFAEDQEVPDALLYLISSKPRDSWSKPVHTGLVNYTAGFFPATSWE